MALCKADLVAAVLKQLGYDVPDPERLTKAVFEGAAQLKREQGIPEKDCIPLTHVRSEWYRGGLRDQTKSKTTFNV